MTTQTTNDSGQIEADAVLDLSGAMFSLTADVGMDVSAPGGDFWLSWEETKAMARWLSSQMVKVSKR